MVTWSKLSLWKTMDSSVQFSSVAQSCLTLCNPMSCSMSGFPVSLSLLRIMSIESVKLSNHLIILYSLLLVLPSVFPSIRVFSNELALHIRRSDVKSIGASASDFPLNVQGWSPSEWTGLISLQSKGLSRVFSSTTVQKQQFFSVQPSSQSNSHIHTWPQEKP